MNTEASMIKFERKDLTTVERGIVIHGVNCQHRMASGVAKAIREKWPVVYERYMATEPFLGAIASVKITDDLYVVNCYTQFNYGYNKDVKYANPGAIGVCLTKVGELAAELNLPIYMPKIGCGLGGLSWETEVKPVVEWSHLKFSPENTIIVCDIF